MADAPAVNGKDLVTPEQLTYVLIALIVAGLALGLLVVVALLARRRDAGLSRQADKLVAAAQAAQAAPAAHPAHAAPASTAADEPADAAAAVHFAGAQPSAIARMNPAQ